jgi:uroporphyrinogen-III decarboxylase
MPMTQSARIGLWKEREARLGKALNHEPVDRIPLLFQGTAWLPVFQGIPLSRYCTDPDVALSSTLDALDALDDVDGVNMQVSGILPVRLANIWLSRVEIPGRELPADSLWQVHEAEVMKVEDYDIILNKGWEAFLSFISSKVQKPDLVEREAEWFRANGSAIAQRYHKRGYAVLSCMNSTIPFEALCGARSMQQFFLDCYRMPDKVKAALDIGQQFGIDQVIKITNLTGVKGSWVGGWRAASALVAPRIWDKMVFPYYVDMLNQLQQHGITCVLHFDQNWDRDIRRFLEFPKGCVLALDGATNIRRAKEILGDHMVFLGDVPSALFATGTPEQVRVYVRDLIRDLGPRGFVMNPGCDIPFNAPKENVQAFVAATHEFGKGG